VLTSPVFQQYGGPHRPKGSMAKFYILHLLSLHLTLIISPLTHYASFLIPKMPLKINLKPFKDKILS
jgi:hypothetical protein